MSDKDYIKDLFQKELGNYEAKVDPSLWNGVQSGINSAAAAGGATTGLSIVAKSIIGIVVGSAAIIGSVMVFSEDEKVNSQKETTVEIVKEEEKKPSKVERENIAETEEELDESVVASIPVIENEQETKSNKSNEGLTEEKQEQTPEDITFEEIEMIESSEEFNRSDKKGENVAQNSNETKEDPKKESIPLKGEIAILKQDNQYVKFEVVSENATSVVWDFGDNTYSEDFRPEHFYDEAGEYNVVVTINGENETIQENLKVNVEVEGKITKLPNVITPNSDGSNDELFITSTGLTEFQLNLYNDKQELIFTTNDPNFKWRGEDMQGRIVTDGKYMYVIMAKDAAGNVINKYQQLQVKR